jgi:hypothetical protein
MAEGMDRILAERERQKNFEGWTADHDDFQNCDGELLRAGMCYLAFAKMGYAPGGLDGVRFDAATPPMGWSWEAKWWKPKNQMRDLERAGALVLAEKERLLRLNPLGYVGHCDRKIKHIADLLDRLAAGGTI